MSIRSSLAAALVLTATPLAAQQEHEPPYIPTGMEVVGAMLSLAGVATGDVVYDLGSGDGRIVIEAARRHGTRGVGYEHQAPLVALSRARADGAGVGHLVRFEAEDLFRADLREATVVMLFLGAAFNLRLRPTLLEQLRPGARVVSNTFHMGDWEPDSTVHVGTGAGRNTVHLWVVPATIEGFWSLQLDGAPALALEFEQRFQRATGTGRTGGREIPLGGVQLRGDRVRFTAPIGERGAPVHFTGRVGENGMAGTYRSGVRTGRWSALRFDHPALAPD
jgi:SAM-dependent methyltransferase